MVAFCRVGHSHPLLWFWTGHGKRKAEWMLPSRPFVAPPVICGLSRLLPAMSNVSVGLMPPEWWAVGYQLKPPMALPGLSRA